MNCKVALTRSYLMKDRDPERQVSTRYSHLQEVPRHTVSNGMYGFANHEGKGSSLDRVPSGSLVLQNLHDQS